MIEVKRLTLFKNSGWMALDGDTKRGIFCYLSQGVYKRKLRKKKGKPQEYKEIPYRKIRLADIHVKKVPVQGDCINYTRGGRQEFASVGFYIELAPYVSKLIAKIYDEITGQSGKPADGRQRKGVDDLLRRTGGKF